LLQGAGSLSRSRDLTRRTPNLCRDGELRTHTDRHGRNDGESGPSRITARVYVSRNELAEPAPALVPADKPRRRGSYSRVKSTDATSATNGSLKTISAWCAGCL